MTDGYTRLVLVFPRVGALHSEHDGSPPLPLFRRKAVCVPLESLTDRPTAVSDDLRRMNGHLLVVAAVLVVVEAVGLATDSMLHHPGPAGLAADLPIHGGRLRRPRLGTGPVPPRWPRRRLGGPCPRRRHPPPGRGRGDRRQYRPAAVERSDERRRRQLARRAAVPRDDGRVTLRAPHRHGRRHDGATAVLARGRRRTGVRAGPAVLPLRVGGALHRPRRHRHLAADDESSPSSWSEPH